MKSENSRLYNRYCDVWTARLRLGPHSLMVGQKVRLKHGPLRGLEGVLTKIANQHRMYVAVTLLKRSISVEVAPEWIDPIKAPTPSRLNLSIQSET